MCYAVSYCVMMCYIVLCHVMTCYVLLCHIILCHVVEAKELESIRYSNGEYEGIEVQTAIVIEI